MKENDKRSNEEKLKIYVDLLNSFKGNAKISFSVLTTVTDD